MSDKKTALVTGANKGLGYEIAAGLGERGYRVAVGARDRGRGEAAVQKLHAAGVDAFAVALDVTSDRSVTEAAELIAREQGRLDVLVNNAGISGETGPGWGGCRIRRPWTWMSYLNAVTGHYARQFAGTGILINAACPGLVAIDFTGFFGRPAGEAAATPIRLATLPGGGPTGSFCNDDGVVPW